MMRIPSEALRGLRLGLLSIATIAVALPVSTDPADARKRRSAASSYSPAYAAIVLDANSGSVLHASNADALRYPASLTKIMTLYMLFERLESGALTLDSPLKVSAHAAGQSPTKLGLKEGSTIRVEDAILGMVTRSANDAAAVVAENLAGSVPEFARQMTRKAYALGMSKTVYRNASGLPDSEQVTTARDQAVLGRAVQEHFPRYYKYFETRSFTFRGQRIGNHNRLLGRIEGVDGIKTGYTRASGFNLVTSVHRDKRYVIAVVLGGASAGSRDARMQQLLSTHVRTASVRRTAPMIARAPSKPEPRIALRPEPKSEPKSGGAGFALASARSMPIDLSPPAAAAPDRIGPSAGSADPIRPHQIKTVAVRAGHATRTASAVPMAIPMAAAETAQPETVRTQSAAVVARAGILGVLPARATTASLGSGQAEPATVVPQPPESNRSRSGWIVQVGAFPEETEAKNRLSTAKSKAGRLLAAADPFTESVQRGSTTLYRARFSGLDKNQAEATCKFLKKNDVDCLAMKN